MLKSQKKNLLETSLVCLGASPDIILAGGNMSVNGQQACFGEFSTFDHEGYFKMILLSPKHAKTCPYKGKKAFFGDFSTVDQVGYRKWLF